MDLSCYWLFSAGILAITIAGILFYQEHTMRVLFSAVLLLLANSTNFIAYAMLWNDISGQVMALLILGMESIKIAIFAAIFFRIANRDKQGD